MTISDAVLGAADENMVQAWRAMLAVTPIPGDVCDDEVVLLSSGLPVPLFNPAFVSHTSADPQAIVTRIVDYYASMDAPFVVYFRDEVTLGLAEACATAGLVEHWRPALMVLDPIPTGNDDPPSEIDLKPVTTDTLDSYTTVLSEGFGMPRDLTTQVSSSATARPRALDPAHRNGWRRTDRRQCGLRVPTVSQASTTFATVPRARGRGIGATMTWAAVHAGQQVGATRAILQSSEQGEPVYQRMGFTTPTRYRQFQPAGRAS